MRSRERWLHEGLEVLAEHGASGLTIDALAARLGLSKGSFYHHFSGMPGYRQALLEYFEQRENQAFIDRAQAAPAPSGAARIRHTVADVMAADGGRPRLEAAVRAWASDDAAAKACLDRVDRARLDFLQGEFEALGLDAQGASDFATIAYLMSIGAADPVTAPEPSLVIRLWERLLDAAARSVP